MVIQQARIQDAPALPGVRGAAETGKEEWRVGGVSETRVCKKCSEGKPVEEFRTYKKYGRVYISWGCKKCTDEQNRIWNKTNPEKRKRIEEKSRAKNRDKRAEFERKWRKENPVAARERDRRCKLKNRKKILNRRREIYAANPELERERSRKWATENPQKIVDYSRKYYEANREKLLEKWRVYRTENREKVLESARRYRAEYPLSYVQQKMSRGNGIKYPIEILETKQMQMKINRLLKDGQ